MTTLATSDLSSADIRSILSVTGESTVQELCDHTSVDADGLDHLYCPGADAAARLTNLRSSPHVMGKFRGYDDNFAGYQVVTREPIDIPRSDPADTIHPDFHWDVKLQHYAGPGVSGDTQYNITIYFCDQNTDYLDYILNWGAANIWWYDVGSGSPAWAIKFTDQDYTPYDDSAGLDPVAAGTYYIHWLMPSKIFYAEWYKLIYGNPVICPPVEIYDYGEPDPYYFNLPGGADSLNFDIYSAINVVVDVTIGDTWITLPSAVEGVGNRVQDFDVSQNDGSPRYGEMSLEHDEGFSFVDVDQETY